MLNSNLRSELQVTTQSVWQLWGSVYKHPAWTLILLLSLFALTARPGFCQAFLGLGRLPGLPPGAIFGVSHAYGVSADGLVIVGESTSANANGFEAFRWTAAGGMEPLGFLPGSSYFSSYAAATSADGSVVVGYGYVTDRIAEPFRWTAADGMQTLAFLYGLGGQANGISADGSVIVGRYQLINNPLEAFRWTALDGPQFLGDLSGGRFESTARSVSADGSVIAGIGWSANGIEAFRWTAAGGIRPLGDLPGGSFGSVAWGISADGSVVVGSSTGQSGFSEAFRWTTGSGMQSLGPQPAGGDAYGVSADGSVIVGFIGCLEPGCPRAFIWTEKEGLRSLQDVLTSDFGINLAGWTLQFANDISDDGTIIVGSGFNPAGQREAWRVVLPPRIVLDVIYPYADVRFIAGEQDTIRWSVSGSIKKVNLLYSLDGGSTYHDIIRDYPADSMKYVWTIPDTMLSRRAQILIQASQNPQTFGKSGLFKIKGYELTRITAEGDYERYVPDQHGWSFGNDSTNMWPQSWWQQFDYAKGIDPQTGGLYPPEWTSGAGGVNAQPQNFPDWPLFVRAFGVNQTYIATKSGNLVYRPSAVQRWTAIKGDWGGSCFGFAASSLFAYDDSVRLKNKFAGIGSVSQIYSLLNNNADRQAINELMIDQFGKAQREHITASWDKTPITTLEEVRQMLLDENRDDRLLCFFNQNGSGGHAVSPYKIEKDETIPIIEWIYIYDPNAPGSGSQKIAINKQTDSWGYFPGQFSTWGGNKGIFLMDLVSNYAGQPVLPKAAAPSFPMLAAGAGENQRAQFYNNPGTAIVITAPDGKTIGYRDSLAFNELDDGIPIIPLTGYSHPPIGYNLRNDSYSIQMTASGNSRTYFSMFTGSAVFDYSRATAEPHQTDYLTYREGLGVRNPDAQAKIIHLKTILINENNERVFDVTDCALAQKDSLHVTGANGRDLRVLNAGSQKSYNLRVRIASADGEVTFEHANISLAAKASHQISPVWENLPGEPVRIYIDIGNDGTIDDSLKVENETTDVKEGRGNVIPQGYALYQNYPNPFNAATEIRYAVPRTSHVTLKVHDVFGREVATLMDREVQAGEYKVIFDGSALSGGVYFYRLQAEGFAETRKLLLLK